MSSLKMTLLVIFTVMVAALAAPYKEDDHETAASEHHGRVQIKVFRGPTEHDDENRPFAPWGYWVKQPADHHHHHD